MTQFDVEKFMSEPNEDAFCVLRATISKFRLEVCKMKKSKFPKLYQNIGLDELYLEKILLVRLDFYFSRMATKSVWWL